MKRKRDQADTTQLIARKYHRVRQDHEHEPETLLCAFTMEAVAIAHRLGMTADKFIECFETTFRMLDADKRTGFAQPTIIDNGDAS